jgi:hypothetical protein
MDDGEVVTNKACLVAQVFSHVECLDFREIFAPVARLMAITILLAFAASRGFKLSNGCEKCVPKWCHSRGSIC